MKRILMYTTFLAFPQTVIGFEKAERKELNGVTYLILEDDFEKI